MPTGHYTDAAFHDKLVSHRRWGRWGDDDQRGALNLIDASRTRGAARLIRTGQVVSLSRDFPLQPSANNPRPAEHFMRMSTESDGQGSATDYIGINFHGRASTHMDALAHVWDEDGAWNGKIPSEIISYDGVRWGGVENFACGIAGRGVILDVARQRPEGFVVQDAPVTGEELARVAALSSVHLESGDILVINCGREAWERANGYPWGAPDARGMIKRPGLHTSCLDFFYDVDCGLIVWDMMDAIPNDHGVKHSVHTVIHTQGIPLIDNALIEPLAEICHTSARSDFMFVVAPLKIVGGTGSPVNPLAIL